MTDQAGFFLDRAVYLRGIHLGASFWLPAHPIRRSLSIYISDPPHAGKQKIDAHTSGLEYMLKTW